MKPYHQPFSEPSEFSGGFVGASKRPTAASRGFGEAPQEAAVEIPELKKKEEERKGAGAAPPWVGSSGSSGAVLGSLVARAPAGLSAGVLGLGPMAAAISGFFGGPATTLGALFASEFGSAILAAGVLAWAAMLGVAGMSLLMRESTAQRNAPASVFPTFAAPAPRSSLVIDTPKNRSLDYVGKANAGELAFNEEHPLAPKDAPNEEPKKSEAPVAAAPKPSAPDPSEIIRKALSGDGLSKTSGGNSFVPGAGLNANKLGTQNFELKKTFASNGTGTQLKLTSFSKRTMRGLDGMATRKAASGANQAMGQLKFANTKSQKAYSTSQAAPAKQTAADAFEQSNTTGDEDMQLGMSDSTGDAVVPASTSGDVKEIDEADTSNSTPYQDEVDSAEEATDNSGALKWLGIMLLIAGAALIVTGLGMLNCTTFPIGLALIGAGTALMVMGAIFLALALSEANTASDLASSISDDYGQTDQGTTASECTDTVYTNGTSTAEECGTTSTSYDTSAGNTVSSDTSSTSNASSAN